jgi:ribosomal protein S18 acetylase RimI-like enzyme
MTLEPAIFNGATDLGRMQGLVAESIHHVGDCGYVHVGDIPHRIYNLRRRQPIPDPSVYVRLWEDSFGQLAAWAILYPHWGSFEFQIHARHRSSQTEFYILEQAESAAQALIRQCAIEKEYLEPDLFEGDSIRLQALEQAGYTLKSDPYRITSRSLDEPIPAIDLPEGFSIRSAAGFHEAEALGKVHSGAFGSNWTAEAYRAVMESPGYILENELVVVAPNGEFAAFTINWFDDLNKTALFEPVGTHQDYQRRGLGYALMSYALHRMKRMGIQTAYVGHETDNPASKGLYYKLGFRQKYRIYSYRKPFV